MNKKCNLKIKLWWTWVIWSKWQIVIQKSIRDAVDLNPWDSVALLYSTEKKHISIIKNDDLNDLFELAKNDWITIE